MAARSRECGALLLDPCWQDAAQDHSGSLHPRGRSEVATKTLPPQVCMPPLLVLVYSLLQCLFAICSVPPLGLNLFEPWRHSLAVALPMPPLAHGVPDPGRRCRMVESSNTRGAISHSARIRSEPARVWSPSGKFVGCRSKLVRTSSNIEQIRPGFCPRRLTWPQS